MINIYLPSWSSCNVGVGTHTQCSTITLTVATCGTAANGGVMTLLLIVNWEERRHGRLGTPVRNNSLSGRPKKMSKGPVDHTKKMSRVVIGCLVAVPRSHWSAACLLHLPVVKGLIFCISATPHLRTSFPLFHAHIPYDLCVPISCLHTYCVLMPV